MNNKTLIFACLAGTAIEWFDFSLFGILSATIASLFFPNETTSISLINTFCVYATGFLMRPIGALFWGYKADKVGRKNVIVATIALMTCSTVAMGLIPTYSMAGIAAPVTLVLLRLMQGFSASGEQASMLTYLYETAPLGQKKILSSISYVSVFFGMSLSILLCLIVHLSINEQDFIRWGWRIPFLSSVFLGYIGYLLRVKMMESNSFKSYLESKKSISNPTWSRSIKNALPQLLASIGIFQLAITAPYIVFVYLVVYSVKSQHMGGGVIYFITFINLLLTSILVYVFASLSERLKGNLRLTSIIGLFIGGLFIYPYFFAKSATLYALAQFYFGLFTALLIGPFCSDLVKIFKIEIRCTAAGICINLSAAIFGGLTPIILSTFQLTKEPLTYSIAFISATCLLALFSEPFFKKYLAKSQLEKIND